MIAVKELGTIDSGRLKREGWAHDAFKVALRNPFKKPNDYRDQISFFHRYSA